MDKLQINLFDSLCAHSQAYYGFWTFSNFFLPQKVEWMVPPVLDYEGISLFSDKHLVPGLIASVKSTYKVAWLYECREIHPFAYENIKAVEDKLDYIFTFDEDLLSRGPKYVKNLFGTTRIVDKDAHVYEKNKLICQIASGKGWTSGHRIRNAIADSALVKELNVDLYGRRYTEFPEGGKAEVLKNYCFEITLENSRCRNYFSEKIIDAFRVGTIPIYRGCDNIGDFFNEKGILSFNTGPELKEILDNLTINDYYSRIDYVKENFELAKEWTIRDDILVDDIRKVIHDV